MQKGEVTRYANKCMQVDLCIFAAQECVCVHFLLEVHLSFGRWPKAE